MIADIKTTTCDNPYLADCPVLAYAVVGHRFCLLKRRSKTPNA